MIDVSGIALQHRQRIRGRGKGDLLGKGRRGRGEAGEEGKLREIELGGKIEMSNYQMTAVDSGISMGMLDKLSLLAPEQSTAVCVCASACVCVHAAIPSWTDANTHSAVLQNPKDIPPTAALNSTPVQF